MKTLETSRLIIRPLTQDDAGFIVELLNTPSFLEFIGDRGVKTIEDGKAYLLKGPIRSYADHGFGLCLMQLKEDSTPFGMCGLIKRDGLDDVDLGFALLPAYEGKGYGFEAASTVMAFGREELGLQRIVAITIQANKNSIHLLEKLGFVYEKTTKLPGDEEELMLFGV